MAAIRERCARLSGFVREAWHVLEPGRRYVHGWHIDAICEHLEAISLGRFLQMGLDNRLLINIPPGMMKSLLVSVFWPAWEWGPAGMPHLRYITTSYSEDLSKRDARRHRDLVSSEWYQALWPVKLVREGETSFANSVTGSRDALAFKSLTGGRADRVIIDDPHSTETVESDAERARTIRIFRESVTERVTDKEQSAIVVIMQRLHERDISGDILERRLPFQHIRLPMEFEPDQRCTTAIFEDPRTAEGELLCPERVSREAVERDKLAMGSYAVAAQWQQRPAPRGGLMFKRAWFTTIKDMPPGIRWVRAWDLAATLAEGAAYTAGVKLGRDREGRFFVGHVVRERAEGAAVRALIRRIAEVDGRSVEISLPKDPGQAGKVQAQDFIGQLAGFQVYATPETGDKKTRAEPVAAQAEGGKFFVLEGPWNEAFFAELESFPTGKYADQVDALSRAFARLVLTSGIAMGGPILVTAPRVHFGDHPGW